MSHPSWRFSGGQVANAAREEQEERERERERVRWHACNTERSVFSKTKLRCCAHAVTRRCAQRCRPVNMSRAMLCIAAAVSQSRLSISGTLVLMHPKCTQLYTKAFRCRSAHCCTRIDARLSDLHSSVR